MPNVAMLLPAEATPRQRSDMALLFDYPGFSRLIPRERLVVLEYVRRSTDALVQIARAAFALDRNDATRHHILLTLALLRVAGWRHDNLPGIALRADRKWLDYVDRLASLHLASTLPHDWEVSRAAKAIGLQRLTKADLARDFVRADGSLPEEYSADPSSVLAIARETWLPLLREAVLNCREGQYCRTHWLTDYAPKLGVSYEELGITEADALRWRRLDLRASIRAKLWLVAATDPTPALDSGKLHTIYLNAAWPLRTMIAEGFTLEEVGIARERFITVRNALNGWLDRAHSRPREHFDIAVDVRHARHQINGFRAEIMPLFDQILAMKPE